MVISTEKRNEKESGKNESYFNDYNRRELCYMRVILRGFVCLSLCLSVCRCVCVFAVINDLLLIFK